MKGGRGRVSFGVGWWCRRFFFGGTGGQSFGSSALSSSMTASSLLVAQPPAAEELHVDPHGGADEPQLLGTHPGADLRVTASDEACQGAAGCRRSRRLLSGPGTVSSSPTSCVHPQVLLNVILDGDPAVVNVNAGLKT